MQRGRLDPRGRMAQGLAQSARVPEVGQCGRGGHAQGFVFRAFQGAEDGRGCRGVSQASQGGDRRELTVTTTRFQRLIQKSRRRWNPGRVALVCQAADSGQFALRGRRGRRLGSLVRCSGFGDPVHAAEHVGLPELRTRATQLVPAARVEDEHRSVGVGEHVGGVEVDAAAHHKIAVLGPE